MSMNPLQQACAASAETMDRLVIHLRHAQAPAGLVEDAQAVAEQCRAALGSVAANRDLYDQVVRMMGVLVVLRNTMPTLASTMALLAEQCGVAPSAESVVEDSERLTRSMFACREPGKANGHGNGNGSKNVAVTRCDNTTCSSAQNLR
jgi:hypothetical protein